MSDMNATEKLHLLTSKFVQIQIVPSTNDHEEMVWGLTEHGQIWYKSLGNFKDPWKRLDVSRDLK